MNDVTCVRCAASVPASETEFTADGAVCRSCFVANVVGSKDVAVLERDLRVSMGRRQVVIGLVMLTIGAVILGLGLSGGQLVMVPMGMLVGGMIELGLGVTKLSG